MTHFMILHYIGFFHITGRSKDLIITKAGENIAPVPIENVSIIEDTVCLLQHEDNYPPHEYNVILLLSSIILLLSSIVLLLSFSSIC